MNRIELEQEIIKEGVKRRISVTKCDIYDRTDKLSFCITVDNTTKTGWVYKHQIEELTHDLAPLERPHEIQTINLDYNSRVFSVGDIVEIDGIWIRLDAGEETPTNIIDVGAGCGQYRSGWVTGTVFETPEQNGRLLGIKFERDIYLSKDTQQWYGDVSAIEKAIEDGSLGKVEKGQPIYSGTLRWELRKKI